VVGAAVGDPDKVIVRRLPAVRRHPSPTVCGYVLAVSCDGSRFCLLTSCVIVLFVKEGLTVGWHCVYIQCFEHVG